MQKKTSRLHSEFVDVNLNKNNEEKDLLKDEKLIMRRYQHLEAGENQGNLLRTFRQNNDSDQICGSVPLNKNVIIFAILITLGFFIYIPFLPFASNRRKFNFRNFVKLVLITRTFSVIRIWNWDTRSEGLTFFREMINF